MPGATPLSGFTQKFHGLAHAPPTHQVSGNWYRNICIIPLTDKKNTEAIISLAEVKYRMCLRKTLESSSEFENFDNAQ